MIERVLLAVRQDRVSWRGHWSKTCENCRGETRQLRFGRPRPRTAGDGPGSLAVAQGILSANGIWR